jgi:hypothetical protein
LELHSQTRPEAIREPLAAVSGVRLHADRPPAEHEALARIEAPRGATPGSPEEDEDSRSLADLVDEY